MTDQAGSDAGTPLSTSAALDKLFQPFNRGDAPGLVVGVAKDGKPVYRRGFGLASVELGVANRPHTRMRIGSTSKHFASLAILLLAEEGKLDIDASARTYIPELPASANSLTLRDFMTHTSGHRCDVDLGFMTEGMAVRPRGFTLATMARQTEPNFARGDKFMYNNGGFHLLSVAIARASGVSFEDFLRERIFRPLGLHDTESVPSDLEIVPGMAAQHVSMPGGGWRRGIFPSEDIRAEGAMVSTVDDMLRWLAHLRAPDKQIGSAASWEQLTRLTRLNNGFEMPYGLGLMRHCYRGVEVLHHPGGVVGGLCQMLTVPAHALDIIVMLNSDSAKPTDLANGIVDLMLADVLGPVEAKPQSASFKAVLGKTYLAQQTGLVVRFEETDGQLAMALLGMPPIPMRDDGESVRLAVEETAVGPFVIDKAAISAEDTAPQHLTISEGGQPVDFEQVTSARPDLKDAGAPLLGRYRCADVDGEARVAFEGDSLVMRITGSVARNALVLQALTNDIFEWTCHPDSQVPMAGVLIVEQGAHGVNTLRLNTWRTRNLAFQRLSD